MEELTEAEADDLWMLVREVQRVLQARYTPRSGLGLGLGLKPRGVYLAWSTRCTSRTSSHRSSAWGAKVRAKGGGRSAGSSGG